MPVSPSNNKQHDLSAVLSATLETWVHQILYTRGVYSKETFGATRFMGIKCYVNRHPAVVSYINETVRLAVPALLQGTADQLSLLIVGNRQSTDDEYYAADKEENAVVVEECILEEYTLRLMNFQGDHKKQSAMLFRDLETEPQFERSLRDLVLRVQTFQGQPSVSSSSKADKDSISFRLELRLTETQTFSNDMKKALEDGRLYAPGNREGRLPAVVRPLHKADTPVGTLVFVQRRVAKKSRVSTAAAAAATASEDAATGVKSIV